MNYWEKRFLKDKASAVNAAEKYIACTQERYFREAQKEIEAAIEKLYRSFADSEKITLAEAKRRISNADFKKIDFEGMAADQLIRNQEYREKMKDLPDDVAAAIEKQHAKYESQLAAYTKKGEITHLSLMKANIDKALIDLYDKNQISMYDMLAAEYEDGYYRSVYNNQQAIGFGKDLAALNKRAIEKAVLAKHNKSNYSKTLYEHCSHFSEDLKKNLVVGLIRGENMDRMAARMRKRLSVSASAARRLVRTETAYIYESATMDAYKECGIEQYEYLATLDGRTSEICRELDGKVFNIKDAVPGKNYPPMHPNCRSTTVCHFADDKVTSRIAKDESGKYYEVPSDMTYKEWKNSFVKGNDKSVLQETSYIQKKNEIQENEKQIDKLFELKKEEELKVLISSDIHEVEAAQKNALSIGKQIDDLKDKNLRLQKNLGLPTNAKERFYSQSTNYSILPQDVRSDDERSAISAWTRTDYIHINSYLRTDNKGVRPESIKNADVLKSMIDRNIVQEAFTVRRGTDFNAMNHLFGSDNWKKPGYNVNGKVIVDKGFFATTPSMHGGFGGDIKMYIDVPKGAKGIYLGDLSAAEDEREFLMQCGTRYIVRKIDIQTDAFGDAKYDVYLEVCVGEK